MYMFVSIKRSVVLLTPWGQGLIAAVISCCCRARRKLSFLCLMPRGLMASSGMSD